MLISRYRDSQSAYLHSINRGGRTSEQLGGGGGGGGGTRQTCKTHPTRGSGGMLPQENY